MDPFLRKYNGHTFEDRGIECSDDFRAFAKSFRAYLNRLGEKHGFRVVAFSCGHYDCFGFLEKDGRYVYLSYSWNRIGAIDVYESSGIRSGVLIRKARNEKDFTGGFNHYCSIADIGEEASRLLASETGLFD